MTIKKVLLQIGKYILATIILFIALVTLGKNMAIVKIQAGHDWLAIALYLGIPLISLFPKSYLNGLASMFLLTVCINFIFPKFNVSYGSAMPFGLGGTVMTNDGGNESKSLSGTYSSDIGGAESKLIVAGDTWYGENRESTTGGLLGNSVGKMNGNRIIDEYGQEIGYINGGTVYVTIGGQRITLKKE